MILRYHVHGSNITIAKFILRRGSQVREHSHVHEQVSIVLSGRLRFRVGGEEYMVGPGDIVHIPPNTPHSVHALEDSVVIDVYSPVRDDWIRGEDKYLRS